MNTATETVQTDATPADDDADGPCCLLSLTNLTDHPCDATALNEPLKAVIAQLQLGPVELSIVIVDDERMAAMHERHTGVSGTTDVLTFDLQDNPVPPGSDDCLRGRSVEGEIFICFDEATRQATARGHAVERELLLYLVHGLLHLLGLDDHDPDDHARMHQLEDELLEAIGVGRVYDRDEATER